MNKLELRILAERLFEVVSGKPALSRIDDETLRKIEDILEEEMNDDVQA